MLELHTLLALEIWQLVWIVVFGPPLLFFFYTAVKNRYFHPLKSFPGPFWASITDVYAAVQFFSEEEHIRLYKLHQKYGLFSFVIFPI
jgi:hypothetical protein